MSLFLLIICLLTPTLINSTNLSFIENRWKVNSSSECIESLNPSLIYNRPMRVRNATNSTNGTKAWISYFVEPDNGLDPYEIGGECEVLETVSIDSYLRTNFSCDLGSPFFKNVTGKVLFEWDFYNNAHMSISMLQNKVLNGTVTQVKCNLVGNYEDTYMQYGVWNITKCACFPCCYDLYKDVTIKQLPSVYNYVTFKIEASLSGPFCEHTLLNNTFCLLKSTTWSYDYEPPRNITYFWCDHIEQRLKPSFIFVTPGENVTEDGWTMTWDDEQCYVVASKKNLLFIGKLQPIFLIIVFILFLLSFF